MPREARKKSQSGIYHVMVRGINQQNIFYDEEDSLRYLETLDKMRKNELLTIHAYCLMGNHIHLVVKEGEKGLAAAMGRIGTGYARWYNYKYERSGHVFQDRYKSEPIESDAYFLTVVRYIHQNPVKAQLVEKPEQWKWSSCAAYYELREYPKGLTETASILGIFSHNRVEAITRFKKYMEEENIDKCLDNDKCRRKTDDEVRDEIIKQIGGKPVHDVLKMEKDKRDSILCTVKQMEGITCRQIARVLGISPSLILKL